MMAWRHDMAHHLHVIRLSHNSYHRFCGLPVICTYIYTHHSHFIWTSIYSFNDHVINMYPSPMTCYVNVDRHSKQVAVICLKESLKVQFNPMPIINLSKENKITIYIMDNVFIYLLFNIWA